MPVSKTLGDAGRSCPAIHQSVRINRGAVREKETDRNKEMRRRKRNRSRSSVDKMRSGKRRGIKYIRSIQSTDESRGRRMFFFETCPCVYRLPWDGGAVGQAFPAEAEAAIRCLSAFLARSLMFGQSPIRCLPCPQ